MRRNEAKYQAKLKGEHTFFDGVPCKKGHIGERYTRNSGCVTCAKEEGKERADDIAAYQRKHKERYREHRRKWAARNADYIAARRQEKRPIKQAYDKVYGAVNSARKIENSKAWAEKNPDRARLNARITQAKRRARKRQATPPWANYEAIRSIYANCPPGMEVDHIVPLAGKTVCGLHVEYNLQYLDPHTNRRKSASLPEHLGNDSHASNLAIKSVV